MCKVVVEDKIIKVRLRLMTNKVFYLGLILMMIVRMLVTMTMVVIFMMNKISQKIWMFEAISIYVL
jgi:hypothetical protein